jgi:hypothetical protein
MITSKLEKKTSFLFRSSESWLTSSSSSHHDRNRKRSVLGYPERLKGFWPSFTRRSLENFVLGSDDDVSSESEIGSHDTFHRQQ